MFKLSENSIILDYLKFFSSFVFKLLLYESYYVYTSVHRYTLFIKNRLQEH